MWDICTSEYIVSTQGIATSKQCRANHAHRMRERRRLSPQVNIDIKKVLVYVFTHHTLRPPTTEIRLKEGLPFLCRAEEIVCALSRFDLNNGNIQDFFKQIQQIATSYPTPTASNKHAGVGGRAPGEAV